jgi:glycosyltransferase involved in cell wall biosynthesis
MKKSRTILFVSNSLGVSGAELIMLDLMRAMDRGRFIPYLLCDERNKQLMERARDLNIEFRTTSKYADGAKAGISGIALKKILAYVRGILGMHFELTKVIRTIRCDLIYANAYPCCLYCLLPAQIMKKPLIWHVFNIREISKYNWFNYKIAGSICNKIITVSNACADNLLKANIPRRKMVTIYNVREFKMPSNSAKMSVVRKELGIGKQTKLIGLFGQPIPEKGHEYFIQAAFDVIKIFPESKFIIVGYLYDSDYQKYLNKLVDDLNLQNHIVFAGWRDDIPEVMSSIDIMAHTRVTPEPAALVLIEAMAMGKPVVASNTGGTQELILDNVTGILVPPKDSQAMANAIIDLLRNPEKARQMGFNGKKRVEENFTLDKHARSIENLFEEVIYNNG